MSLIDEALKRARMEAAQKAAESEGLPYPAIPRHLGPRRRRGWLGPLVVALAVIAGIAVGAMLASRGAPAPERVAAGGGDTATARPVTSGPAGPEELTRDPSPAPADATPAADSPGAAPAADAPSPAPPADAQPEARPVTSGPAAPSELRRDPVAARPPAAGGGDPEPPAGGRPSPPSRSPAAAAPAADPPTAVERAPVPPAPKAETSPAGGPAPAATVTDPDSGVLLVLPERAGPAAAPEPAAGGEDKPDESFAQRIPLPGGGTIELGGIAWSETGPFALINGRVVGPGSVIDGFTLESIRRGHVVLTGDGRRIRLSLQ